MKTMAIACRAAALALTTLLFGAVSGGEIRVMTCGAFTAAFLELKPQFEGATRQKVVTLATTMGTGPDFIPNRLQRGEAVDVVIVDDITLDKLIRDGKVSDRSKVSLGRSTIGMAVRAGAPKPDISSIDALKRTLLQAKSIAYSASISGEYLSTELFPRLGIADQIASKSRRVERERVGAVVARGEAEIGFQQVSELLPIQGIDYVGPLPGEIQRVTVFSAGIVTGAMNPDAASAFIRFLASPDAARIIAKSGLEPIAAAPGDIHKFSSPQARIDDVNGALRSGRTTCKELVQLYLKRIVIVDNQPIIGGTRDQDGFVQRGPSRRVVFGGKGEEKVTGMAHHKVRLYVTGYTKSSEWKKLRSATDAFVV